MPALRNNTISNCSNGIEIADGFPIIFEKNKFVNLNTAVKITNLAIPSLTFTMKDNIFDSSTNNMNVSNESSETVDVSGNYWGTVDETEIWNKLNNVIMPDGYLTEPPQDAGSTLEATKSSTITSSRYNQDLMKEYLQLLMEKKRLFEQSSKRLIKNVPDLKNEIIAVVTFDASPENLGVVVSDIYAYFLRDAGLKIVDRKQLQDVIDEVKLALAGITDKRNQDVLGKLLGATLLLTGTVGELGDRYVINAKLIDISTGITLSQDSVYVNRKDIITIKNLEDLFAEKKYPLTGALRSALIPGWGQFYNDQPIKGILFMGLHGASLGYAVYNFYEWQLHINSTAEGDEYAREIELAREAYERMQISLVISFLNWLGSIIDGYTDGFSNYFFRDK